MNQILSQLVTSASDHFRQRYDRNPRWIVAAPGRVNLIGEHIDYNNGFVLPMAIDRYCVIAAAERIGDDPTVYSAASSEVAKIRIAPMSATGSASTVSNRGHWSNYV